jgi:anthranilate phosphoribosyltransferase
MASKGDSTQTGEQLPPIDIKPLLSKLWPINATVTADEIADAISYFFTNQVTEAQTASLLMALHFTKLDFESEVLAKCAAAMRRAAEPISLKELRDVIERRGRKEGAYRGGLVRYLSADTNRDSIFSTLLTLGLISVILSAREGTPITLST